MDTLAQAKENLNNKGFLDIDTKDNTDYVAEINRLKKEKNAVILAHYYQEAVMKPKGLPAVPNYRTRVTQAFVKEDGMWRVKAAHWSPLQGGAGTSQTVVK